MTTIDDLKHEYESLFEREKKIDEELQLLLANQSINDAKFNSLKSITMKIQMVYKDSQNLSNMINFTSNLADNVSNKVRQLDLAKGRVTTCIKRVTDILDLKACTDGVTEALKEEDYESAANHIHKYLSLDKESLRLKTPNEETSQPNGGVDVSDSIYLEHSFRLLQEAKLKLQSIVTERYEQAWRSNDIPELERFFKIFPLIGLRETGIERFSAYLCSQIHASAEKNFSSLLEQIITGSADPSSTTRWSILFADSLILLYERVARLVEAYQPVIEASYGYGNMAMFVRNIQRECDQQAVRILAKFRETRRLAFILRCINSASYSRAAPGVQEDRIDPRDLDELLTEITLISSRTELYKSFLLKSIIADLPPSLSAKSASSSSQEQKSSVDQQGQQHQQNKTTDEEVEEDHKQRLAEFRKFINSTTLQCNIQELVGQYSVLENYFMTENINKAIQMDAVDRNSLTSSVVDDTFFIIKKCINDSVDGCCAMFNNCSTALESIYKDYFYSKLKAGYPGGFDLTQAYTAIKSRLHQSGVVGSAGGLIADSQQTAEKINFLITLNNIEESIECVSTIKKLFEVLFEQVL